MAEEIAGLVISINSTDAVDARKDLDDLTAAGGRTEAAAKKAGRSWMDAVEKIAASTSATASKFDALNGMQSRMLGLVEKIAGSVDRMAAAYERSAGRTDGAAAATKKLTDAAGASTTAIDSMTKAVDAAAAADRRLADAEDQAAARIKAMVAASVERTAEMNRATQASLAASTAAANLARAEAAGGAASGQAAAARRAALDAQMKGFQQVANEIGEVNAVLASVGRGAGSMQKVQDDTNRLIKLWEQGRISADQYDAAIKRLDADERRLADAESKAAAAADQFITKLKAQADAIGKTRTQLLQYEAAKLGVTAQAAPFIKKIDEAGAGLSRFSLGSKQAQQQLMVLGREVASGSWSGLGSSMSVMAQESGILTKLMSPLGLAIGATAAIVAIAAAGFYNGAKEANEYSKAIIQTGNYAGLSTTRLIGMAQQVSSSVGTTGAAAEALTLLATSARFSADQMPKIATAALAMKSVTGKAIDETVAEFVKLADEPVKASEALNKKYNFLTVAVYEQIRALEEQGRHHDAAVLAENTYANSMTERAAKIKENLGTIERGWLAVASATKRAIDAAMNVGRGRSEADITKDLAAEQARVAKLTASGAASPEGFFSTKPMSDSEYLNGPAQTQLQAASGRVAQLQIELQQARSRELEADAAGVSARVTQDAVMASANLTTALKNAKDVTAKARAQRELIEQFSMLMADKDVNEGKEGFKESGLIKGVTRTGDSFKGGAFDTLMADVEKRFTDTGAVSKAASAAQNALQGKIAAIQAQSKLIEDALKSQVDHEKASLDAGEINKRDYYARTYDAQADALQKQLGFAQQEENVAKGLNSQAAREAAAGKVAKLQQDVIQNAQKYQDELAKIDGEVKKGIDEQIAKWAESETAGRAALDSENALFGKSGDARALAATQMKAEAEARERLLALAKVNGPISDAETKRINDAAKAHGEAAKQIEANMLAAQGAQQLLDENRRFQADSILDEKQRAATILEIDAQVWRERIANATEGSQERRRLEEQFDTWYSNRKLAPEVNRWKSAIGEIDQDFKSAFLSLSTDGETKSVWKTFTKSLGASLKTQLASALYETFIKKYVVNAMINMAGMIGGPGVANALSGQPAGSGLSDSLGTAKNALDFGNGAMQAYGGFSTGASTASLGYANAVQAVGGDGLGALIAGNGSWAGVPVASSGAGAALGAGGAALGVGSAAFAAGSQAAGAYVVGSAAAPAIGALVGGGTVGGAAAGGLMSTLGGAMSAIGTAMPYIGAAIAIYTLLSGSFKGEKRSGGTFGWADGQSQFLHGPSGGTDGKEGVVNAAISATAGGVNGLLKAAGSALSVSSLIAGFEGSEKGRGGVMSGVTLSDGRKIGEDGTGSNYKGTYYNKNLPTTLTTEVAAGLLVTDLKQLQIEVLQSADDIPDALRKLVDGVDAVSLSDDAATALLGQISAQVAAVEGFRKMVEAAGAPLEKFKDLSYDLTVAFVDASGGLEKAQGNLTSFYETYHTESERMGDTFSSMEKVFDGLGLAVPATKEEFRALVEGLSLTDEAAVKTRATLLGMNQTFAGWADYAAAGAKAVTDALQANEDSYAKGYSTEAERNAKSMESMRAAFTGLGLAVPFTRDGFRALVESLDSTTEAGRKARATLLGVSEDFGTFADRITAIVTAARDAAETAATGAMSSLTRSVNAEKNRLTTAWQERQVVLQEGIDAASTALAAHKALSDRVKSTLNSMFGQTDAAMQRSQAQAQISGALATARAGGGLPDVATLENALGIVSQPSQALFATFEDYQLDFLKTANDIAALGALTDSQVSIEERTLALLKDQMKTEQKAYDDQIKFFDQMLEKAQEQLDAAMGNNTALLTVAQALEGLRISLASLSASKPPPSTSGGAPAGLSKGEQAVWDAYQGSGIGYLDAGGWSFWNEAIKNGADPAAIAAEIAAINAGKVNGSHANGLDYVPFDGYIAELHRGERVQTAAEARAADRMYSAPMRVQGGSNDAEVVAELRALRQEVQGLRAEAQATAQHTAKTAKVVTRWDIEGMPESREVATA